MSQVSNNFFQGQEKTFYFHVKNILASQENTKVIGLQKKNVIDS